MTSLRPPLVPRSFGAVPFFAFAWLLTVDLTLAQTSNEVARVNQVVITQSQLDAKYRESLKYFQSKPPTRKSVLEEMIRRELGAQEARRTGIDKEPDVQDRLQSVLFQALVEKRLGKDFEKIKVAPEEAKKHYLSYPDVRTSHIFVAVSPTATPEETALAKAKIQRVYDQFVRPGQMSFAEIAQRHSEGIAAPMGGDIDFQGKEKLDPVYYQTALSLKAPGKVSGIIRSQFGFHIIKLTAIRPWDEVDGIARAAAERQVFEIKRNELFESYMKQLRSKAQVTVRLSE